RARGESRAPDVDVFEFIHDALTCELPTRSPALAASVRHFARKFQQVSAPTMAKGVEDTAFYRYNRLASLNDVGGDPMEFGFPPAKFHRASAHRAKHWPHTMLATSTHDNKRSEDVRARIDALSELAAGWRLRLRRWHRMNLARKAMVEDAPAPTKNDEYLLYQVLLGSFPPGDPDAAALDAYRERIVAYMQKAMREAKARTSWARVNEEYEAATTAFINALLDTHAANPFLEDLRAAAAAIGWLGFLNSVAMVAVKYTSPGVPDCYQGNELLDLSLVDPDNRRPVDYDARRKMLDALCALPEAPDEAQLREIFTASVDGRAKLYVMSRLLRLRQAHEALFVEGSYAPLRTSGTHARHVVAYARRRGKECAVTVVPRLVGALGVKTGELPCGEMWGDTRVEIPFLAADAQVRDVLTGRSLKLVDGGIALADLLRAAPVSVLCQRDSFA
ncbi:MAG TPA: malto-oligosyltrehalose synthase, partial [Usitatibacter sp.]|nr:malto-oligosyltrehalose synthase [Usitatibacter sp.]